MSGQVMATAAQRVAVFKGEILKHVVPQEVIGKCCRSMKKQIPKNNSATVKYRRWLPKGATTSTPNTWSVDPAAHVLGEGETPLAESVTPQDITATLQQYGVLYRYSDVVADLYEDNVPAEMVKLTGERMGLLMEMIRYGVLKAGTNIYRSGAASSLATVAVKISANLLRNIARGMDANLASKMTAILPASPGIGTQPIEAAFVMIVHSDLSADCRALSGFVHISEYGSRKPIHENELGSWEQFRFVTSAHLAPQLAAGTTSTADTILTNGANNSGGSGNADVYTSIVLSEEAYGDVMLRGMDSFQAFHRKPGGGDGSNSSPDDPLGQRGHVGAKFYMTAVRLNELHMAVVQSACSSLIN